MVRPDKHCVLIRETCQKLLKRYGKGWITTNKSLLGRLSSVDNGQAKLLHILCRQTEKWPVNFHRCVCPSWLSNVNFPVQYVRCCSIQWWMEETFDQEKQCHIRRLMSILTHKLQMYSYCKAPWASNCSIWTLKVQNSHLASRFTMCCSESGKLWTVNLFPPGTAMAAPSSMMGLRNSYTSI